MTSRAWCASAVRVSDASGCASTGGRRSGAGRSDELDLGALGRALWRRKGRSSASTLLAAALAFAAVNMMTPRYKSEARVLIETPREHLPAAGRREGGSDRGSPRRSGSGDQPGPAHPVARSRARRHPEAQARRAAGVRSGAARHLDLSARSWASSGIVQDPMSMTPEERVLKSLFRPADRVSGRKVPRHRDRVRIRRSRARRARRQRDRRRLSGRCSSRPSRTRPARAGPWLAGEIEKLRDAVADAEAKVEQYRAKTNLFVGTNNTTLSNQQLGELNAQLVRRARAEGRCRGQGAPHPRHAAARRSDRVLRHHQFRADAAAVRAARHAARAARRAVLDAARPASAHQGIARRRSPISTGRSGRGREAGALARERRQARERQGRRAQRQPRPAQAAGGIDQRAGRAAARARARGQGAARPARILSRQIPRGDRARQHRRGAARRAHHLDRGVSQHARLAEEAADRAGRGARHVCAHGRLHALRAASVRAVFGGGAYAAIQWCG